MFTSELQGARFVLVMLGGLLGWPASFPAPAVDGVAVWLILGSVIALLVEVAFFKGACAMADLPNPSWLLSSVVMVPLVVGRGAAAWGATELLRPYLGGFALLGAAYGLAFVVFWVACFAVCTVAVASVKKSLYTASAQVVLDAVAGGLVLGVLMFTLAVLQLQFGPSPKTSQAPAGPSPVAAARATP